MTQGALLQIRVVLAPTIFIDDSATGTRRTAQTGP
jgi:hypothetical protein